MGKNLIYMTPAQVQETKTEIANLERMLASDQASRRPKIQDKAEFMGEIAKKKELLKKHEPKKLSGERANKALKEARAIENEIKEGLLSTRDYYMKQPKDGNSLDFDRAVREEMRRMTDKSFKEKVFKYKSIMRQIDPTDPTVTNIERFRR